MATIVLVVHPERADALDLAKQASEWLESEGHRVVVPTPDGLPPGDADLAVSLGGDGTMLRTVELVHRAGIPVLGVNVGHLGYLTATEPAGLRTALECFLSGRHSIEERMTLDVSVQTANGRPGVGARVAFNEAVVEKSTSGHTIRMSVAIAGRPFITYAADGLIVATATGSTAYNLSSRGPIASPRLRAIIVTPVSPHMLFDRALVLEPSEEVAIELVDRRTGAALVVDGARMADLEAGDTVVCRANDQPARLVDLGGRDFHGILKAKFGLQDRSER